MAVVDTKTGRIEGTKKDTWTWWHEQGHIAFDKTSRGFQYGYMWLFSIFVSVVFNALYLAIDFWWFKLMTIAFAVLALYYYAYEEIWCWNYARRNKK